MELVTHEIEPVYNSRSRILILGTFPSVKSREAHFFYHHPQNRFWRVLAAIMEEGVPNTIEEKKAFLLRSRIAVWDVIASCRIQGSSDSSIRDVVPCDLNRIFTAAPIEGIYTNGKTAGRLYAAWCQSQTGRPAVCLPSTSPANAVYSLARLIREWRIIEEG